MRNSKTSQAPIDPAAARALRVVAGISQQTVAARIERSQSYYSSFERGRVTLRDEESRALAELLGAAPKGGRR